MVLFLGVTILLASTYVTLNSDTAKDSVVKVAPLDGILADTEDESIYNSEQKDVNHVKVDGELGTVTPVPPTHSNTHAKHVILFISKHNKTIQQTLQEAP